VFAYPSKTEYDDQIVSVKTFGVKGDGQSDDAEALEKAMIYCIKNDRICFIPKTKNFYNIASTIRVSIEPGQSLHIVSNGAVIKPLTPPVNSSAYNLTLYKEHIFLSIGKQIDVLKEESFNKSKNSSVKIKGLVFDGINLKEHFATTTFDTDIFIGLQILAENVEVDKCLFRNIYGYGVRVHNVKYSTITNCKFDNVGGRGATSFAQKVDRDAFGDGIYHALVKSGGIIKISNCIIRGKKAQNKRSRVAITFEYSTQPYKIFLSNLEISGFAKCIHIEEVSPTIVHVDHVKMSDFNFGIANVLNDKSVIYFNNTRLYTGFSDGNDAGDALGFLNYHSKAKIYVDSSILDFNGRQQAYQSAVGLTEVQNSTINGHKTNFFFAGGNTVFSNCTFVDFGGAGISFLGDSHVNYQIIKSDVRKSSSIHASGQKLKLSINNVGIN
jgi:hypothetical protein